MLLSLLIFCLRKGGSARHAAVQQLFSGTSLCNTTPDTASVTLWNMSAVGAMVWWRDVCGACLQGLLNPILEKYNEGALTAKIFGVPAMQAVIEWKWVSCASAAVAPDSPSA